MRRRSDLVGRGFNFARDASQKTWTVIRPNQALSWQTLMFLSLFSWLMALLTSDSPLFQQPGQNADPTTETSPVKYALFTMGWIFLTMSVGWLLAKSKYKLPFLEVELRPAAWIAGAITCAFAFRVWNDETRPTALSAWFLVSALYYVIPRVLDLRDKGEGAEAKQVSMMDRAKKAIKTPEADELQKYILVLLVSILLSCWTSFYFLVQDWLEEYPALQAVPLESGAFVSQFGSPPEVLAIAETVVANRLEPLTVPEIRGWLANPEAHYRALNDEFDAALRQAEAPTIWQMAIVPGDPTSPDTFFSLRLFAEPAADPTVVASPELAPGNAYALDLQCEASSLSRRQVSSPDPRQAGAVPPVRRSAIACREETIRLRQHFS